MPMHILAVSGDECCLRMCVAPGESIEDRCMELNNGTRFHIPVASEPTVGGARIYTIVSLCLAAVWRTLHLCSARMDRTDRVFVAQRADVPRGAIRLETLPFDVEQGMPLCDFERFLACVSTAVVWWWVAPRKKNDAQETPWYA